MFELSHFEKLDYLLKCVSPVIGTEYVEPPNGWTWDGGGDLLKEGMLSSDDVDLTLSKAPGVDEITPGWSELVPIFYRLCSGCLKLGMIPQKWRETKTSRADLDNPKAYRPISLTSFQLKVYERAILINLLQSDGVKNAITRNQHAYMACSST